MHDIVAAGGCFVFSSSSSSSTGQPVVKEVQLVAVLRVLKGRAISEFIDGK